MSQKITQFDIPTGVKDIVLFVHGFGVRWDSRGMFTDIKESLPKDFGSVLFDFYDIEDKDVFITSIEDQIKRLRQVIGGIKQQSTDAKLHIIAHSKGCIITALAKPEVNGEVIMLAPPESFGTTMEKYFSRYPGAKKTASELIIPRKDGTITHIPLDFFPQTQAVDAEKATLEYSEIKPFHILQTTEDEVIGKTNYRNLQASSNIDITPLAADHNFTDKTREKLIDYIKEILHV